MDFDSEKFYQEETLSKMKINDEVSMEIIYEKKNQNIFSFGNIKICDLENGIFRVKYKEKLILEYIFEKPIKIKYKNSEINIISMAHLNEIIKKYNIITPIIRCESCVQLDFEIKINELKIHKEHDISLQELFGLERISSIDFDAFFNKEKDREKGCLGKEFNNPEEFEPNFQYYFDDYEIYKNMPFLIYNNDYRKKFILNLIQNLQSLPKKIDAYFGQSGMGKSISIIASVKYIIDHDLYGTLYLNMKCLNILLNSKEYHKFKQIIIDEIPYLFKGDYNNYLNCTNLIHQSSIEGEDSLWDLISKLIKFILDIPYKKKYIFIFDQYNNKIDKNGKIIKIHDEFISNQNKKQIGIVSLSSMNNEDIKEYKIDFMKDIFGNKYKKEINYVKSFNELNDIFDIEKFHFEDDTYEEYYELLGKNIKHYNILYYYFINQKKVEELIKKTKTRIIKKLKSYYNCEESEKNIIKILYFSTTTKYDLDTFLEVANFVPFKYFIPKIKENLIKKKYIQIDFAFPLIEEIINELLDKVIYSELNIYKTLTDNKNIDGGARGYIFEKFITYLLDLNSPHITKKRYFKDVNISEKITLRKFIQRSKEKPIKERKNKIKLKKGTYLFTQKIINGKALDILIVYIDKNNNSTIIAIQITIHKPKKDIFDIGELKMVCESLFKNMNKLYDFNLKIEDIYFTYIFDKSYEKYNKNNFNDMLTKCNSENISYIFFNPEDNNFYNKNGNIIEYLKEEVKSVFNSTRRKINFDDDDDSDLDINYLDLFPKEKPKFPYLARYGEIDIAINILKKDSEFGYNIKRLKFFETKYMEKKDDFKNNFVYLGRTSKNSKSFIIYFSKKYKKFIRKFLEEEDNDDEINKPFQLFDVYEIELK